MVSVNRRGGPNGSRGELLLTARHMEEARGDDGSYSRMTALGVESRPRTPDSGAKLVERLLGKDCPADMVLVIESILLRKLAWAKAVAHRRGQGFTNKIWVVAVSVDPTLSKAQRADREKN